MVSNDWKFVCCFSIFTTIVVIMEHTTDPNTAETNVPFQTSFTVESEKPTISGVNNEVSRQRTFDFLQNITMTFPPQLMNLPMFFPSVNTAVCFIPKNGHSVLRFVHCLLTLKELKNETAYNSFNSLSTYEGYSLRPLQCLRRNDDSDKYRKIAFIRDPIERFISGYLFVCKRRNFCFNCGSDFGCFLETLYFCWTKNMIYSVICAHGSPTGYMVAHLAPQANYCNNSGDFEVVKYSRENINNFLLTAAEPLLSEDEYKKLLERVNKKTSHAANEQDAKNLEILIRSNRTLTRMLAQLYFMDYKTFDIDIPLFSFDRR